jgi:hypothetical protein
LVTFESVASALAALPRLFFEPDGSFVWVAEDGTWQLDGQLYDRGPALDYVEIKGTCASQSLEKLLVALRSGQEPLTFHLVREGVDVDEGVGIAAFDSASRT